MIQQGDIYWTDLNPTKGHEQAGKRPIIILQNDILNQNLNTIIIAPTTTNLEAKDRLITYFLPATTTGLREDSVALLYQARTLDKKRLKEKITTLSSKHIQKIKEKFWNAF